MQLWQTFSGSLGLLSVEGRLVYYWARTALRCDYSNIHYKVDQDRSWNYFSLRPLNHRHRVYKAAINVSTVYWCCIALFCMVMYPFVLSGGLWSGECLGDGWVRHRHLGTYYSQGGLFSLCQQWTCGGKALCSAVDDLVTAPCCYKNK